ncbi:MAG: ABC transporter substrate-binding protein [Anaerolineae bacterium]|nr:ABC transporter substrate-binding protein [Anaerolineae bacterium]MDW8099921.1 ABC transporter substrate-binding protein [Anaerolineae bacterium]
MASHSLDTLWEQYRQGRISRREFLQGVAAVAGLAGLQAIASACAPTPAPAAPAAPTATPETAVATPQPEAPAAIEPKWLIYSGGQDVPTLDPSDRTDYSIGAVGRQLYDRLFRFEGGFPRPIEPCLCERWEGSDDAREWIFHLTNKAVFHDGTPVTAEAVKYSYGRTLRFQRQRSNLLLGLLEEKNIEVVDDYTVRMVLNEPYGDFPRLLAYQEQWIMNPKVVKDHEVGGDEGEKWLIEHEAGSGPFVIKEWQIGDHYSLEAVPDYWQGWPGRGRLAGFTWRIIRDTPQRRIALLAGEVDFADTIGTEDVELINNTPGYVCEVNYGTLAGYFKLNNQKGPTADVNFRRFLAYAFDYEGYIKSLGGLGKLLVGPIPDGIAYHDPNVQPVYRYDLEKAREALNQTPYKDGGIELDFVYVTGLTFEEQAGLILLDQLSKFNIKLDMIPKVWPDMVAACNKPETGPDISMIFVDSGPLPDVWFREQWYSPTWDRPTGGSFQSCDFYKNPEVDSLIEQVRRTVDEEERARILKELQRMIMEDIPGIPIYVLPNLVAYNKRVKGFKYFGDISVDFWRLWIED